MELYLAHSGDFWTSEVSPHLQTYFPEIFPMAPPEMGKSGVGGSQIKVKYLLKSKF